ncbi:MAG: hypothetical protein WCO28_11265 [Bacteroidota bacterium]|jgi:hypothetical protein
MNIGYTTAIISVLLLLIFGILSFIKTRDIKFQVIYIVVASFNIGIISSIILINYDNKSALIWPILFLFHVASKAREIMKDLN